MVLLCLLTTILIVISCRKLQVIDRDDVLLELGHNLFFENQLSFNGTKSCSSCHSPDLAFTDGYRRSVTSGGETVKRNAPSLLNISDYKYFNWADSSVKSLGTQHMGPLFNKHPVELGLHRDSTGILDRLSATPPYSNLLKALGIDRLTEGLLTESLAFYVQRLESRHSRFDAFLAGAQEALSESELEGYHLFTDSMLACINCHSLPDFTSNNRRLARIRVYYPSEIRGLDSGLYHLTGNPSDIFAFRVPSLRNVALTSPYFHDGSAGTLTEVLEIHGVHQRVLTEYEKKRIIEFLHVLTDSSYKKDQYFKLPKSD